MLPIFDARIREINRRRRNTDLILQRKIIRSRSNPFNLPEQRFIELFRLDRQLARSLIERVGNYLHEPVKNHGISVEIAVLTALRFYATGCYQRSLGQDFNFGLSQTSVHRCVHQVTNIIDTYLSGEFIRFPQTRDERQQIKVEFMDRWGFPGTIGAIDGTHIAILKPVNEEHNFINRKGFHSLNVQIICDHNLQIRNLNANYGGSTHDAFIWRNSAVQTYLRQLHNNGETNSWLIGDSGYPLQPYLMTPVANVEPNSPEAVYNGSHAAARNCVERCIGLLKMRFRCILRERVARYAPQFVASIVTVCATLHNMCIQYAVPLIGDANEPLPDEDEPAGQVNEGNANLQGYQIRNTIIQRYFA